MMLSLGARVALLGSGCSTNKSVNWNQTLADWIDGDEEAF